MTFDEFIIVSDLNDFSMLKIGLTGGIGSGKTTVSQIFSLLGISVFYADDVAKNIMNEDENLKQNITALFGEESYKANSLNRKYIADIVFNDAFKLEQLNALVHPVTIAAADNWMNEQTTPYVIKEAALMFESIAAAHLDYIIGVYAPQALRVQRVMHRDNIKREDVLARMNNQIDEDIKMKLCDFVIVNDEQQAVLPQVLELHEKFLEIANSH
jgi:dephospho-CoA kinase